LMALPAGVLADRWGKRRTLVLGAVVEGCGMVVRATLPSMPVIGAASFVAGAGQALLAIAAAPFLSEHSSSRERTHLFSSYFAVELMAAVGGSLAGGMLPKLLWQLPHALAPDRMHAYRYTLLAGAALAAAAALPIARIEDGGPGEQHAAPTRVLAGAFK